MSRLRSVSELPLPSSSSSVSARRGNNHFDRSLSAPDLATQNVNDSLDPESAVLLASIDETERTGNHYLWHSRAPRFRSKTIGSSKATPPDYNLLAPLAPRYPIFEREEMGNESLPNYSPSIVKEALLLKKNEMSSPFSSAPQRSWAAVHVELNNTQLNFYRALKGSSKKTNRPYTVGRPLRSYTLQYAEIGVAVDYTKRPFVIRVRAEQEQFLLECATQESCIVWMNVLQMAIDLALPLEERRLPKYRSIPRRTRRNRESSTTTASPLSNESASLSPRRSNRPRASTTSAVQTSSSPSSSSSSALLRPKLGNLTKYLSFSTRSLPLQTARPALSSSPTPSYASNTTSTADRHRRRSSTSSSTSSACSPIDSQNSLCPVSTIASSYSRQQPAIIEDEAEDDNGDSDIDQEEEQEEEDDVDEIDRSRINMDQTFSGSRSEYSKWDPGYIPPTYASFLRYAQRCLATLTSETPWTNKTIILDGKKFIVRQHNFERLCGDYNVPAPVAVN